MSRLIHVNCSFVVVKGNEVINGFVVKASRLEDTVNETCVQNPFHNFVSCRACVYWGRGKLFAASSLFSKHEGVKTIANDDSLLATNFHGPVPANTKGTGCRHL